MLAYRIIVCGYPLAVARPSGYCITSLIERDHIIKTIVSSQRIVDEKKKHTHRESNRQFKKNDGGKKHTP